MKRLLLFIVLGLFIVSFVGATGWAPLTKQQALAWIASASPSELATIVQNYDALMNGPPQIAGPNVVAVLEKNGTLHVYWTTPDLSISWADPNSPKTTLLKLTVPLPTLTQKDFYKAPPYPIGDVLLAGGVGFAVGALGVLIYSLITK